MCRSWAKAGVGIVSLLAAMAITGAGCGDRETRPAPQRPRPERPRRRFRTTLSPATTAAAPVTQPGGRDPAPWLRPRASTLEQSFEAFRKVSSYPAVRVPEVPDLPRIDGERDELYARAAPLRFRHLADPDTPLRAPTTAYVVTAKGDWYFFFECAGPHMNELKADVADRDAVVWADEAVEIFLDPSGLRTGDYYHVVVNTRGVTYDARGRDRRWDRTWNPKIRVAAKVGPKAWTLEVALPFAELLDDPAWVPRTWAGNLNRLARLAEGNEDSAWCPTGSGTSHVPARFGTFWLDAGNAYATDFAKWTGPRHVYRRLGKPIFQVRPAEFELIRQCRGIQPSPNRTYCFGLATLPNNAEAVVVATEDRCAVITSTEGWKPLEARWLNNKLVYVHRLVRPEEGYYGIYDAERRQVVYEELDNDGAELWERLSGVKRPRERKPVPWP